MKPKTILLTAVSLLLLGWIVGLGCYPLLMWSPLNCRHEYVDLQSGRIMRQQIVLGMAVRERVEESPISRVLATDQVPADWQRVQTFSPCVDHSPHYRYHGCLQQMRELQMIWELGHMTVEAQRKSAVELLKHWQQDDSGQAAEEFLNHLSETMHASVAPCITDSPSHEDVAPATETDTATSEPSRPSEQAARRS
ncbi:hypothetical protein [Aeoliella mucimassa]|uniref:Uncharacterized protein n=1 Tax=Aeoliella mucimassa TaxID=2527972 RepID=A0A518AL82_9BACT|nr:hypothetical protein [Aeoliella mucimassa]QDU55498.1 hypothetical protein Pan181_16880 [Aeoliella mucimassa]